MPSHARKSRHAKPQSLKRRSRAGSGAHAAISSQGGPSAAATSGIDSAHRRRTRVGGATLALLLCIATAAGVATQTRKQAHASVATKTVTISAAADTYISELSPTKVYGSSTRLSATSKPNDNKVAYLRFAIPAALSSTVVTAHLVLTRDEHHFTGSVSIHTMADPWWNESTLTARTAPSYDAASQTVTSTSATVADTFDVTAAARAYSTASFALTSSSTNDVARFRSREAAADQPKLVLAVTADGTSSSSPSSSPTSTPSTLSSSPTSTPSTPSSAPTSTPSSTPSSSPSSQSGTFTRPDCSISSKLVPSCGRWWGVAPRCFTSIPLDQATALLEADSQRPEDIIHQYHVNGGLFPTATEKALALDPNQPRMLLENWKPATDMSWRDVADGKADSRIDAEANYLRSSFNYPFFLTIWHEPENDVNATAGSGMTAADYAAMFHHTVARLRADGATKFVSLMNYMGYVPWAQKSWFSQLWPGNDVVDWIGIDPYGSGDATGYMSGDLNNLINRTGTGFPGYYSWATSAHPNIPIMVAEWGVKEGTNNPGGKAKYFASVASEIGNYPWVKAMVYFDTPGPPAGEDAGNTEPESSASALAAWRKLGYDSAFVGPAFHYASGALLEG